MLTKFNLLAAVVALVVSPVAGAQLVPLTERGHVIAYGKSGQYVLTVPADCRSGAGASASGVESARAEAGSKK